MTRQDQHEEVVPDDELERLVPLGGVQLGPLEGLEHGGGQQGQGALPRRAVCAEEEGSVLPLLFREDGRVGAERPGGH